jgi:hypothetical protein
MLHVIEKSRHSGPVDLIREAIDGSVPAGVAARRLGRARAVDVNAPAARIRSTEVFTKHLCPGAHTETTAPNDRLDVVEADA